MLHRDGTDDGCHHKVDDGTTAIRGVNAIEVQHDVDRENKADVNQENSS
jgi:hypothetical protein